MAPTYKMVDQEYIKVPLDKESFGFIALSTRDMQSRIQDQDQCKSTRE
jgi:hypothetical protein